MSCTLHFVVLICLILTCNSTKEKSKGDEKWKKKDIRDYSEADLERLFDQWEVSSSTSWADLSLCLMKSNTGY